MRKHIAEAYLKLGESYRLEAERAKARAEQEEFQRMREARRQVMLSAERSRCADSRAWREGHAPEAVMTWAAATLLALLPEGQDLFVVDTTVTPALVSADRAAVGALDGLRSLGRRPWVGASTSRRAASKETSRWSRSTCRSMLKTRVRSRI